MDNEVIKKGIIHTEFIHKDNRVTICIARTKSNYYIVGTSFCLDKEIFNKELGEKYSFEDVVRQLEPLMGYVENLKRYKRR